MGLICCCFRPKLFRPERSCILEDKNRSYDVLNDISVEVNPTHNSSVYRTPTVGLTEQNRFDNTVQKMANKMINISAHSEQLPQTMWRDRQKTYARKVLNIRSPLPLTSSVQKFTKSKSEPNNVTIQERCATIECIREEDLKLINKFSQMSSNAIKKGFSFWSEEPIVVELPEFRTLHGPAVYASREVVTGLLYDRHSHPHVVGTARHQKHGIVALVGGLNTGARH
ncbi:unnamed protein product [Oppiella nova]|uniref:Uncharacterized protein n=1 Tax=Oppiella nova TaxID=334625 RepID=A0A7R9LH26_9ACAR|nr:unnamed protein product [Oppiella nova]CAG2163604.1 unnamed protein product [Oppiella nova]